jgi:hypothetical protein
MLPYPALPLPSYALLTQHMDPAAGEPVRISNSTMHRLEYARGVAAGAARLTGRLAAGAGQMLAARLGVLAVP